MVFIGVGVRAWAVRVWDWDAHGFWFGMRSLQLGLRKLKNQDFEFGTAGPNRNEHGKSYTPQLIHEKAFIAAQMACEV